MPAKLVPDPYLADVTEWPHTLVGKVDVVDSGGALGMDYDDRKEEADDLRSYWGAANLELADGNVVGFAVDGSILVPEMIRPEEFDEGAIFRISLDLSDQAVGPVAIDGKLVYYQGYKAIRIERAN